MVGINISKAIQAAQPRREDSSVVNSSFLGKFDTEVFMKKLWLQICELVQLSKCVRQVYTQSYFDTLQGVHDQQTQLLIEDIKVNRILERSARLERVEGKRFDFDLPGLAAVVASQNKPPATLTESEPVAAEPLMTDTLKIIERPRSIRDMHSSVDEQIQLLIVAFPRLQIAHRKNIEKIGMLSARRRFLVHQEPPSQIRR